jgi:hypothetical protein
VRKRLAHLRPTLIASAIILVVGAVAGLVGGGAVSVVGVVAGVGLVVFSYTISSVIIAYTDLRARSMLLAVGLATYLIKFTAFGGVLYVVNESRWDGAIPMAGGIVAGTVAWVTTQAVWVYRSRIPYVDLTEASGGGGS